MDYPGNPLKLTPKTIINHYARTGFCPVNKRAMNSLIREQHLYLLESHAFYLHLLERGVFKDDGGEAILKDVCNRLGEYIKILDVHSET